MNRNRSRETYVLDDNVIEVGGEEEGEAAAQDQWQQQQDESFPREQDIDIVGAAQRGLLERCRYLIEEEGVDVNQPDHEDVTILHWAAINNRLELVRYLIAKGAIVDALGGHLQSTALQWAVRQGYLDMVVLLMKSGADPTIKDNQGFNSLHLAAQFGHTYTCAYLIAKGVHPDVTDNDGRTALMWAAYRVFYADTVRVLIGLKSSVNLQDITSSTALHWAAYNNNLSAIKELLAGGARWDLKNNRNQTAEDVAAEKDNVAIRDYLQKLSGSDQPAWLRAWLQRKGLRGMVLAGLPLVFLVTCLAVLANLTWPWAILALGMVWAASAFVVRVFWIPQGKNPFTFAIFTQSCGVCLAVYAFWLFHVNMQRIGMTSLFWIGFVAMMYFFRLSWRSPPGFITSTAEQQRRTVVELAEQSRFDNRFCPSCVIHRPLRSKHCSICGHCVAKFDHHCPFIDNCVGVNNHRFFLLFLLMLTLTAVAFFDLCLFYLRAVCTRTESFGSQTWTYFHEEPAVAWTMAYAVLQTSWCLVLLVAQHYQVAISLTTNEHLLIHRMTYLHDEQGKIANPFDKGPLRNLLDFYEGFGIAPTGPKMDWARCYEVPGNEDECRQTIKMV